MDSLVSVVIPVYNMEKFIRACVDSITTQTYSNIEIVLVNDGSKDNSAVICDEIAKTNSKIVLIHQENKGVSAARNVGIRAARGEFLIFLDADDSMPQNAIAQLVEAAKKFDSDMTMGKLTENENLPIGIFEGKEFLVKALEDNPIAYYSCRTLFKRSFIQDIAFPEGFGCGEDSYFVFECALKKPRVATINELVYCYYVNPNSATHSPFSNKRYSDICELLNKKELIISNEYPDLLPLFYHLKTKIQMMLLTNFSSTKSSQFRQQEKETLMRFNEVKKYFQADLPSSNVFLYKIFSKNLYYPFKFFIKLRTAAMGILRK